MIGDAGVDVLFDAGGDDRYALLPGFEQDTILDLDGNDSLTLPLPSTDIGVVVEANDLILSAGADAVRISGWFANENQRIESIAFSDGVIWDSATLTAESVWMPTWMPC